jgi:hypothetical protein
VPLGKQDAAGGSFSQRRRERKEKIKKLCELCVSARNKKPLCEKPFFLAEAQRSQREKICTKTIFPER